ncbi:MAG TPA: hypothetical protein VIL52_00760 [Bacteroidota bacterium]
MTIYRWASHLVMLALLLGPCDETLPPYTEPESFFEGKISSYYDLRVTIRGEVLNGLSVYLVAINTYDETFDDIVELSGSIEFMLAKPPAITKTITLTSDDLYFAREYDEQTGRLVIDPQDSLIFSVYWDLTSDDNGVDPRRSFTFTEDPTCPGRCLAAREEFIISGRIIIFGNRAPVRASMLLPVCYVSRYVSNLFCQPISTHPPCIEPPPVAGSCNPFPPGDDE